MRAKAILFVLALGAVVAGQTTTATRFFPANETLYAVAVVEIPALPGWSGSWSVVDVTYQSFVPGSSTQTTGMTLQQGEYSRSHSYSGYHVDEPGGGSVATTFGVIFRMRRASDGLELIADAYGSITADKYDNLRGFEVGANDYGVGLAE